MHHKHLIITALSVASLLPIGLFAQADGILVTGRVIGKYDSRNDTTALAGATLTLKDSTLRRFATADIDGHYSIVVPDTASILAFEFIGFRSIEERVGDRTRIDVVMGQDTTIDPIVVFDHQIPPLMGYRPIARNTIVPQDIEWATPQTLSDVLEQELPGIEFTLVDGQQAGITFQGLDASYLLVLLDGRRMAGETTRSNPDLGRIDIDRVQRIEITRTPSVVRYGSGAVSGVIDIITKQPRKPLEIGLNGRYDTGGEQHYSAAVGSRGKRLSGSVSGVLRHKEPYFLESSGNFSSGHAGAPPTPGEITQQVEIEGFSNYSTSGQLAYKVTDALHASARAGYYAHERHNAGAVGKRMHDLYRDLNGGAQLDWSLPDAGQITISYDVDQYTKLNKYLLLDSIARNYRHTTHHPKALYTYQPYLFKMELEAGVELLDERLESYQFAADGQGGDEYRRDNLSAFASGYLWPVHWLGLQGGLRADHDSDFGTHLTPGITALIEILHSKLRLRAGYAGAFRAPTLKERYTDWEHLGIFQLVGNPDLQPETSHTFSAGIEYDHYLSPSLSVNAFYTRIDDKIATVWSAAGDTLRYANASSARVAGVDFSGVVLAGDHWVIRGGYAWVHDFQQIDGKNISSVRPHSATAHVAYWLFQRNSWAKHWSVNLSGRWSSAIDQWALDSYSGDYVRLHYPGYAICKLSLTGGVGRHFRFAVGVDNLFDYVPKHVTFNAGITPGRSYFLRLSYSL